ncbi:MAG: hypothetical protein ABI273_20740 [Lacunisphaera sp.]
MSDVRHATGFTQHLRWLQPSAQAMTFSAKLPGFFFAVVRDHDFDGHRLPTPLPK